MTTFIQASKTIVSRVASQIYSDASNPTQMFCDVMWVQVVGLFWLCMAGRTDRRVSEGASTM